MHKVFSSAHHIPRCDDIVYSHSVANLDLSRYSVQEKLFSAQVDCWPRVHLLLAPSQPQHHHRLRGQAGRNAGPGPILSAHPRIPDQRHVYGPHGDPCHQEGG